MLWKLIRCEYSCCDDDGWRMEMALIRMVSLAILLVHTNLSKCVPFVRTLPMRVKLVYAVEDEERMLKTENRQTVKMHVRRLSA